MKELLTAIAAYNKGANAALSAILVAQPESLLREDQGSFYKSVFGTFEHLVASEVSLLKRYATYVPGSSLGAKKLVVDDIEDTKSRIAKGVKEAAAVAAEADALLLAFVGEVDEAQLAARVKYKTYKGEEIERYFWSLLFHIFNHGTHHRGEISALLDRVGVKNDYSGFNNYTS
ncbi:MAG TPA: DinB family protein [Rectinemataceae bacterium]|nr:DinB family protein [Rectinemataceae bacterium]